MAAVYSVTQINSYIKNMFRQDFVLTKLSVKGEISNCKYHTSGHIYFTLKDECGCMSAIMFSSNASKLNIHLEDGMKVVVSGHIDVYERDGRYQIYVSSVEQDGIGDLYKKFEQLKKMYEEMGYFSNEYKRKIPLFSKKIGIVTASTGAAVHDIMNISYRRNPYVTLILYPALVQGKMAASSIARGIQTLDKLGLDVIIAGRGGGSIEDLWAFNEEEVIEAVFNANTPVISAVGHETDFTITDFVADLRAPTPSAAAELAVCDIFSIESTINDYLRRMRIALDNNIGNYRNYLKNYDAKLKLNHPKHKLEDNKQYIIYLKERLDNDFNELLNEKKHLMQLFAARLEGVSPLNRLKQGYSFTENESGLPVKSVEDISLNDKINVYVSDGIINAKVTSKKGELNGKGTNS